MLAVIRRLLFNYIPTAIAVSFGGLTLLAVLLPDVEFGVRLGALRDWFVALAGVLAAFALLAGFLNVVGVHAQRIALQQRNWPYSVALLLGMGVVLAAAAYDAVQGGRLDPGGPTTTWLFDNVIVQLEIAVVALVAFFLAVAAYRALRRPAGSADNPAAAAARPLWGTLLFLFAALVVLLRTISLGGDPLVQDVQSFVTRVVDSMALGGARGLLIGVALGTIATGLRVLVGADRPHSE